MNKRNVIITIAVLIIAGIVYFQQGFLKSLFRIENSTSGEINEALLREVSTLVAYNVPNGGHNTLFSVFIDQDGNVANVTSVDDGTSLENQIKLNNFSKDLVKIIRGKKLSELEDVDIVGTSSITTKAFNEALPKLKAQL
jgi:hypothetical protein